MTWLLRHLAARGLIEAKDGWGVHALRASPALASSRRPRQRRGQGAAGATPRGFPRTCWPRLWRGVPGLPARRAHRRGHPVLPTRLQLQADYFERQRPLRRQQPGRRGSGRGLATSGGATIPRAGRGLASGATAVLERLQAAGQLGEVREYRYRAGAAFPASGPASVAVAVSGELRSCRSGRLDMNRPFGPQGVAPASLTAVYAVNTLHVAHAWTPR